ncbi:MAG: DNA recombination protein RmuC [Oscillospiraceae bacterium]|nr:DNA recombination protein RmuC [Oscillospiraceae bacterium]
MEIAILILLMIAVALIVFVIIKLSGGKGAELEEHFEKTSSKLESSMQDSLSRLKQELNASTSQSMESMGNMLSQSQSHSSKLQQENVQLLTSSVSTQLKQFEERLKTLESTNQQKLEDMRTTMTQHLDLLQKDNANKLENIRSTVDEKLQKTLEEKMTHSFQLVSQRLEEVYKGLGEMQNLASGVGDLKKVLSNVKTRGILGEIQLGAILSEILAPEQYDTEVPTIPGSRDHVEFAVKLPAAEKGEFIYLPVDSKFPGDTFAALQDAYSSGDPEAVKAARKQLENVIKKCAKDISTKYISPPYTTNFGILFLPFEGLYAEVVNMGLVEDLQRDFHVNIAGPSTMAAMLNALQMGFQTLQIQKRSNEVWQVLGAVKTEFEKFESVLTSAQNRIRQLDSDLDKLVGVRTRGINRKLRNIEQLDDAAANKILGSLSDDEA